MATVAELKERIASLPPPGSEVRQAFVCRTAANFGIFVINWLTGLTLGLTAYRYVATGAERANAHPLNRSLHAQRRSCMRREFVAETFTFRGVSASRLTYTPSAARTSLRRSWAMHHSKWPSVPSAVKALLVAIANAA